MKRLLLLAGTATVLTAASITAALTLQSSDTIERCVSLPHGPASLTCYTDELLASDEVTPDSLVYRASQLLTNNNKSVADHFLRECHEVFHDIGERFARTGVYYDYSDVPFESCTYGMVHGSNDVRLAALSNEELLTLPADWCPEGARASHGLDGFKHSCLHGVGHEAMERALQAGSFNAAAAFASDVCTYTGAASNVDRAYFTFHCLDGAFMQWALDSMRVDPTYATPDPIAACRTLTETNPPAAQACYRQVTPLILDRVDTLTDLVAVCEQERDAIPAVYVRHCIRSVAANVMGLTDSMAREASLLCAAAADQVQCVAEFDRSESYDKGPEQQPYGTLCAAVLADAVDVNRCTEWASDGIELLGVYSRMRDGSGGI